MNKLYSNKIRPVFLLFLCWLPAFAFAQQIKVIDNSNQPLVGVTVMATDSSFLTVSDLNGNVTISASEISNTSVTFSYIGYQNKTIELDKLRLRKIVKLTPSTTALETFVVIGRRNDPLSQVPAQIDRISKEAIALTNPQTSADAIAQHSNAFVQKSQMGGGSPILRGFEANKILLVVDGVRMNNAIYRSGHLQNAITVDANSLEQLEVIYGPGALTYGSDALGGVIHFRTKTPKLASTTNRRSQTNFFARYTSANQGLAYHLDYEYGRQQWASLTSLSYNKFGDLHIGENNSTNFPDFGKRPYFVRSDYDRISIDSIVANEDPFCQRGTAYSQIDLLQKFVFQSKQAWNLTANFQFSTSSNVPRYDNLTVLNSEDPTDLRFAEWYYGPQNRFLASLSTNLYNRNHLWDKATFIAAFQRIEEDRFSRRFGRSGLNFNLEDVAVYSLTADFTKSIRSKSNLTYGIETNYNTVASEAGVEDVQTNKIERTNPTRYPSGENTMTTLAAYTAFNWQSKDSIFNFQTGLRYTFTHTYSLFSATDPIQWTPTYYTDGIENRDQDLNWGISLTLKSPSGWQARLSSATAFRAPNLDDFSKIRVKGDFVTIPNPDLDSERSINGELTLGKVTTFDNSKLQVSVTGFYTHLRNAIVRVDFPLPDGSFNLDFDGTTVFTQANINADKATIYGLSANVAFHLRDKLKLTSSFNWTEGTRPFEIVGRGFTSHLDLPLAHIPPSYGRTSLEYRQNKWTLQATLLYNGKKSVEDYAVRTVSPDPLDRGSLLLRDGTADNLEYTAVCADGTFCIGTPAWWTLNLYSSYQFTEQLQLNLGIENITDLHYRPFASGVSAAGRNFMLGIRGTF